MLLLRHLSILFWHDLLMAYRCRADWVHTWLFFLLVVCLFPLAITPDKSVLHTLAPGLIWIAALLAILLALAQFLRPDYEDGSLTGLLLSPHPLPMLILAKILAHWFISTAPLLVITPLLAILLNMTGQETLILLLTLLLGTPILSFIGAIAMSLTVSLRHNGVLLMLLILPLCTPVLIFATGAVMNVSAGLSASGPLALLAAMLILSLVLAPFAVSAALRLCEY